MHIFQIPTPSLNPTNAIHGQSLPPTSASSTETSFYLRGCIELPILGTEEIFLWGAWSRVHEKDYDTISDFWETEGREEKIGPFKGRLANSLSIYPQTSNLRLQIRIEPVGVRPRFILEEPEHILCVEQRSGLTIDKAREYSCLLMRMAVL